APRPLGARLAPFAALSEGVSASLIAGLLLGQAPGPIQLAGAVLVLAGVVVPKLGEPPHAPQAVADAPIADELTAREIAGDASSPADSLTVEPLPEPAEVAAV